MTVRITVETKNWPAKVTMADGTLVEVEPHQSRLFTVSVPEAITVVEVTPTAPVAEEAPKISLKKSAPVEGAGEPAE